MTTDTKEFTWSLNSWQGKVFTYKITLEFDANEKITDWKLFSNYDEEGEILDELTEVDSTSSIAEIFEGSPSELLKAYEDFNYIDFYRYEHSQSGAGIVWKPTNQFIGVTGYYDSWNGTDWHDKVVADVNAYTSYSLRNDKSV